MVQIELRHITVGDLVSGYSDDGEGGVRGFGGELDIRPPFQREFVYGEKQRTAVIDTVMRDYPLNVMYWADRGEDAFPRYEIIDGQQRTISLAQYAANDFSFTDLLSRHNLFFENLPPGRQQAILDYELTVYVCSGTDSEKLDWFRTINIAGAELTAQELRNAVYSGSWVADAKRWFSRNGCAAQKLGGKYLTGKANRQEHLETAVRWISGGDIENYMGRHQHDEDADELWAHFKKVVDWVRNVFPEYRPAMKQVDWGPLHDEHKNDVLDPDILESRVAQLVADDDVQSQPGIYRYVLAGDERHLNLRSFTTNQKQRAYEKQDGGCPRCRETFDIGQMEADHITPWSKGGRTDDANCQVLCKGCNRRKGAA